MHRSFHRLPGLLAEGFDLRTSETRGRALALFSATLVVAAQLTAPTSVSAQSTTHLAVLEGLVPFGTLLNSPAGREAKASNYVVTGAIQSGKSKQPLLESLPLERDQALKDAFITGGNAGELADGLGRRSLPPTVRRPTTRAPMTVLLRASRASRHTWRT